MQEKSSLFRDLSKDDNEESHFGFHFDFGSRGSRRRPGKAQRCWFASAHQDGKFFSEVSNTKFVGEKTVLWQVHYCLVLNFMSKFVGKDNWAFW